MKLTKAQLLNVLESPTLNPTARRRFELLLVSEMTNDLTKGL